MLSSVMQIYFILLLWFYRIAMGTGGKWVGSVTEQLCLDTPTTVGEEAPVLASVYSV